MRPWMVALLLAVAALVAISVTGLSASGGQRPSLAGFQRRWFGDGGGEGLPRAAPDELAVQGSGCPASFGGTCQVTVAPSGRWLRRLEISTTDQVEVRFVPASTDQPVPIKLTGSFRRKDAELVIDRKGARLELRCVRSNPVKLPPGCTVSLR